MSFFTKAVVDGILNNTNISAYLKTEHLTLLNLMGIDEMFNDIPIAFNRPVRSPKSSPKSSPKGSPKGSPASTPRSSPASIPASIPASSQASSPADNSTSKRAREDEEEPGITPNSKSLKVDPAGTPNRRKNFLDVQFNTFIHKLAKRQCRGAIGEEYGISAVADSLVNNDGKFDLLMIIDLDYRLSPPGIRTPEQFIAYKLENIKGFIMVEKGECRKHDNIYSVRLICSPSGKGTFLLGMYMHTIFTTQTDKIGILELAGGYINTPGLCAYYKFGFRQDDDLIGYDCLNDADSMPMSADLNINSHITGDMIIDVSIGNLPRLDIPDRRDIQLCGKYKPINEEQRVLHKELAQNYEDIRKNEKKEKVDAATIAKMDDTKKKYLDTKNVNRTGFAALMNDDDENDDEYDDDSKFYCADIKERCFGPSCVIAGGKARRKTHKKKRLIKTKKSRKKRINKSTARRTNTRGTKRVGTKRIAQIL